MKTLLKVLILVSSLTIGGCNEKDDTQPEFLTVEISPDHSISEEIFVFVTDNNGGILDTKTVKAGSVVNLRTASSPDRGNLTICYPPPNPSPSFYTITGLQAGERIRIDDSFIDNGLPTELGTAFINVENCDDEFVILADGIFFRQARRRPGNNSIEAVISLREPSSSVLVSGHRAIDEPVYGWVDDVVDQGTYSIDFNTFTPYPKTVAVSFEEYVSCYISGRKKVDTGPGYIMMSRGFVRAPQDPSVAKFGYLGGYDEYTMAVSAVSNTDDYYHVVEVNRVSSSLPEEVFIPDNTLTIENASISDFRFTYSSTFTFSTHQWKQETPSQDNFYWTVYSDNATVPPIKELPKELAEKYPFISWEDLKHIKSEFRTSEDDYTYREFIQDAFDKRDNLNYSLFSDHSYWMDIFHPK